MTTDDLMLIVCFKASRRKIFYKCTVSTGPWVVSRCLPVRLTTLLTLVKLGLRTNSTAALRTHLVWMLKARWILVEPHNKLSLLLVFCKFGMQQMPPLWKLWEGQSAMLIILLSLKPFLQKENSPKFIPEYGSERSQQTIRGVYEKLKRSYVTPKRAAINLLQKPNTGGRKAFSLIKESRQKSHLICLLFLFLQFSWCAGVEQPWQRLWTLGKRSHYWKSLTHTSLGMLLMSWKTRTLAVTPNNQSYGKH